MKEIVKFVVVCIGAILGGAIMGIVAIVFRAILDYYTR